MNTDPEIRELTKNRGLRKLFAALKRVGRDLVLFYDHFKRELKKSQRRVL